MGLNDSGIQTSKRTAWWQAYITRLLDVRPGEGRLLAWGGLCIFSLMTAYYVLRPVRDMLGVAGGVENLPWLFTGTLLAMLAVTPAYAALVRALPRRRFIPLVYLFFISNLVLFAFLFALASAPQQVWIGRGFFIWLSVFNLFVVSVFWALMADLFEPVRAKRLFGVLAAAASVGAIAGSSVTATMARALPLPALMLCAALLLTLAILCVARTLAAAGMLHGRSAQAAQDAEEQAIGGGILAGITHTLRSPYLANICFYMLAYSITSTFLYFQQATIARDAFADNAERTAFFAAVDLTVNTLTLLVQLFLTGRLLRVFGVTVAAAFLPALTLLGFGVFAAFPVLAVLVAFQVLRRVGNFGLSRPTRELLFTVLPREDKYKAKNVIDTVVYRLGDQLGSWSYALLGALGFGMVGVSLIALPLAFAWVLNGVWLGRRQQAMQMQ